LQTIYLVRHAESAYNPDEYGRGLTEKGKRDALRMTEALKAYDIDLVVASPYKRAVDTVQGIAVAKKLPILLDKRLRERQLAIGPVADFDEAVKAVWMDPDFSHPGGESNRVAAERGTQAIGDLLHKYHDKSHIVVGTHGNLMTLIMQRFDARYDYHFWKNKLKMPDVYGLKFQDKSFIESFHLEYDQ